MFLAFMQTMISRYRLPDLQEKARKTVLQQAELLCAALARAAAQLCAENWLEQTALFILSFSP
jgi:hypothetical protein